MTKLGIALGAMIALSAFGAGSGSAEAGGRHFKFGGGDHGFHEFNNRPRLRIVIGNDYGYGHGCGYFYDRWLDTGSFYWKQKFLICRGRW